MKDRLVEIQYKDLQTLKQLYTPDGLKGYIAYMTIDNYIRWLEQNPDESKNITFSCLNGDFSDGTFVVTERTHAYADTLNESFDNLHRLVQLIDYSKEYFFLSIRDELWPVILDALQKAEIESAESLTTLLYYMPKEEALKFTAQRDDVQLRPFTELKDLEKANAVWPHSHRNSNSLQCCAKYNPNIGAFKKDGTLVAWVFCLPCGLLGAFQTDKKFYGQGYGTLVLKYNSRAIAQIGHDVYAGVLEHNTPSRSLFNKLGFKQISKIHWIYTKSFLKKSSDSSATTVVEC